jgi:hypothetical protein
MRRKQWGRIGHGIPRRTRQYSSRHDAKSSIAFLGVSILFLVAPDLRIPFSHLEVRINQFLRINQTDFIRGYFEYLISSTILALCVWTLLQWSSGTRLTKEIIRSVSGVMLLLAPPAFWVCFYQIVGWPFGWPYHWAPVELEAAVSLIALFLLGKWPVPRWIGVLLLAAHYNFWYWMTNSPQGSPKTGQ